MITQITLVVVVAMATTERNLITLVMLYAPFGRPQQLS